MMNSTQLTKAADNVRVLIAAMVEKAKSGHPGGSMGGTDFTNAVYSKYLVYDPENPTWIARDRFFLDPGHMSPMLYGVLALTGKFTIDELKDFRQWGSVTTGHPELNPERGIENGSGPLGQGHVMAVGCAIGERFLAAQFGEIVAHKTYAFISDGGIQEEISQGAGRIAGYLGLNNLIMFFDANEVQLSTKVNEVTEEDTAAKYRAWNWNVLEINGNDPVEISNALEIALKEEKRPTLIIGKTIMGKGCVTADGSNFEGQVSTHGQPLSKAGVDVAKTIENLGGNPENPWEIWEESKALYEQRRQELMEIVARRHAEEKAWAEKNPELAQRLQDYIDGKLPLIDFDAIAYKENVATRTASGAVLSELGDKIKNMIVSSADLANSDKTDAFLKKTHAMCHRDLSGGFLHAGVAELTMASIMNGIALHGGLIGACGTFFVFSDYMKPAIRMSALMELPVKYVFTHDAFRVGEDGPTHQPVEHEAQMRLLEEMKNSKGEPSVLVLRPADSAETVEAWKKAMENTTSPTVLILTRQDVNDLPSQSGDRKADAKGLQKGGYVVMSEKDADVVLVANGSEVSLLCQVAAELKNLGVKAQVVSVPSIGLYMSQPETYKKTVIPTGKKIFGLTVGVPSTLYPLMRGEYKVYGLERFGSSAPFKVLDEKFGYTFENILGEIQHFLQK